MTLYETIFIRRSVRQYDSSPPDETSLSKIRQVLDSAKQLSGQSARFEIANASQLKGCAAPHAILAYAADTDIALANIGYTLQGVDLYLQSIGLGSVWMGMGKPIHPESDYRILLAFGKTSVPPRTGENEFKRQPVLQISNEDNVIARAARLAPSAVNFQPWKLHFARGTSLQEVQGKVTVHAKGRSIGKLLVGKLQRIDLGIILKHVELALEHEGKKVQSIVPSASGKDFSIDVAYQLG
jgi:nitroreductase